MKRLTDRNDLSPSRLAEAIEVSIGNAEFPAPFPSQLEFNPPVHGTWNIVHIGMNIPESHQIYVCGINCMRGVVLTAAEMNEARRFSCVVLREEDLIEGTVEEVTLEGTADVLNKLPKLPPVVILFTVCTHHFLGTDLEYIYSELGRRFPEVKFVRGLMDPICQKEGLTPDQKLRLAMYDVVDSMAPVAGKAAIIGSNVPLDQENDILKVGMTELAQASDCSSFEEFEAMGQAQVFIANVPNGALAAEKLAGRLGRPWLYMPMCFDFDRIRDDITRLEGILGIEKSAFDHDAEKDSCIEALARARSVIGDTPVMLDYASHPAPMGMARLLLENGFNVKKIYINAINPDEERDFMWLKENHPDLRISATIQPAGRAVSRPGIHKILAIGQHSAWYNATPHFVNMVEGGGLYGYKGIRTLAELMTDAFLNEKDTEDIVPRKGLGCASCV